VSTGTKRSGDASVDLLGFHRASVAEMNPKKLKLSDFISSESEPGSDEEEGGDEIPGPNDIRWDDRNQQRTMYKVLHGVDEDDVPEDETEVITKNIKKLKPPMVGVLIFNLKRNTEIPEGAAKLRSKLTTMVLHALEKKRSAKAGEVIEVLDDLPDKA